MKKKFVHKAIEDSVITRWEKTVQLVDMLIDKGYPEKVIKLIIKIIDLTLLLGKLFDSIKNLIDSF